MMSPSISPEQLKEINQEYNREYNKLVNIFFWNGRFSHWCGGNAMTITKLVLEALAGLYGCHLMLAAMNPIYGALFVCCSLYFASRTIKSLGINEMEEAAKKILGEIPFESIPVLDHDPKKPTCIGKEEVNQGIMRIVKDGKTTHLLISYEKSKKESDNSKKEIKILCFGMDGTPSNCPKEIKYVTLLQSDDGRFLEYLVRLRGYALEDLLNSYKLLPINLVN